MRPDGSHFLVLGESGDPVAFPVTEERFSAALQSGDLDGICRAYEKGCEARRRAYNTDKWRHRKIPPEAVATVTQLFTPESLADYIAANACRTQTNIADSPFVDCGSNGSTGGKGAVSLLDPAVGCGMLMHAAAKALFGTPSCITDEIRRWVGAHWVGFDIDPGAASVAMRWMKEYWGICPRFYVLCKPTEGYLEALRVAAPTLAERLQSVGIAGALSRLSPGDFDGVEVGENVRAEHYAFSEAARALSCRYDVVLVNPPYLSSSDYPDALRAFLYKEYSDFRRDLAGAFLARAVDWLCADGALGVVCPYGILTIKQFAPVRKLLLRETTFITLTQLQVTSYRRAVVGLAAFVVLNGRNRSSKGSFLLIPDRRGISERLRSICRSPDSPYRFSVGQERFEATPNQAMLFSLAPAALDCYRGARLSDVMEIRQGLATGNNAAFLRPASEVPADRIADAVSIEDFDRQGLPYARYLKGGRFRKWYGNFDYVIRFDAEARARLAESGNRMPSRQYYFKPCITWTLVSSKGVFGARLAEGCVFDVGGSCGFVKDGHDRLVVLAYLCSKVATYFLNAQNPTANVQVGDLKALPYLPPDPALAAKLHDLAARCVAVARDDWQDYAANVSVPPEVHRARFSALKEAETEINRLLIDRYGLSDVLTPDVPERLITLKSGGSR